MILLEYTLFFYRQKGHQLVTVIIYVNITPVIILQVYYSSLHWYLQLGNELNGQSLIIDIEIGCLLKHNTRLLLGLLLKSDCLSVFVLHHSVDCVLSVLVDQSKV